MAKQTSEAAAREIHRRTRRKFSPEEKIRIVLEGPLGEESAAELCRRKGIAANLYYRWSNDFHEAGGSPDTPVPLGSPRPPPPPASVERRDKADRPSGHFPPSRFASCSVLRPFRMTW